RRHTRFSRDWSSDVCSSDLRYLFQISEARIHRIDPQTGEVLDSIPAPGNGGDSGLAWAEGSLWVGEYRARRIHQVDPQTGKVLRSEERRVGKEDRAARPAYP